MCVLGSQEQLRIHPEVKKQRVNHMQVLPACLSAGVLLLLLCESAQALGPQLCPWEMG